MQVEEKPFAPFGDVLHLMRSKKLKLKFAPFFFCGKDAYQEAKKVIEGGQIALCLPYGQKFENFTWPISETKWVIYDTGGMSSLALTKLAYEMLKQGAELVALFSLIRLPMDIFAIKAKLQKDLQHGKSS